MLILSFNPNNIIVVNLLPQNTPFPAAYFLDNLIISLTRRQQRGNITRHKWHLYFDKAKCHTAPHVQEEPTSYPGVAFPRYPHSLDLAIGDFYMFGQLEQKLSGRTLDGE
jgi:hypothetical protein